MRISVVIPAFNAERFLGDAIESALAQDPAPFEVLVVDDGSTDATAAVAARCGERVRCLRRAHRGEGAARNVGNAHAAGELIAPLDADDLWPKGSLASRVAALTAAAAADAVMGQVAQFRLLRDGMPVPLGPPMAAPISSALLLRREAVVRFGPQPEGCEHAEIAWLLAARRGGLCVVQVERVVAWRRLHDANVSLREQSSRRRALLRVLKGDLDARRGTR